MPTGILTPEEQRALFAAALEDQSLFDALAREQPLRDLLEDPAARATLLAALAERPSPWYRRMAGWAVQPRVLAPLAAVLCLAVTATIWEARQRKPQPVLTARVAREAPVEAPPVPSRVPEPAPPLPVAKARAAVKRKAETAASRGMAAADSTQLDQGRLTAPKEPAAAQPAAESEVKSGVVGAIGGFPQIAGQLTPLPQNSQAENRPVPSPSPAAAPQVQAMASVGALVLPSPLTWKLLRRQPDGEFAPAGPGDLEAGDAVKLQVDSKDAGYVYLVENAKVLASSRIEAGKPFDMAIEPQGTGRRDLELWFSPREMVWTATGQARPAFLQSSAGMQSTNGIRAARQAGAAAGVGGSNAAPAKPVSIVITLNYR